MNYGNPNLTDNNQSSMDGEVINMEYVNGMSNLRNNITDFDSSFDGEVGFEDLPSWNNEPEDDFYNAGGFFDSLRDKSKSRRAKREDKSTQRQDRRNVRTESKAQSRLSRSDAKVESAKANQMAAQAAEKSVAGDIAMADALAKSAPAPEIKKSMSTGAKIGIAVGVAAVIGLVVFMVIKSRKNSKG